MMLCPCCWCLGERKATSLTIVSLGETAHPSHPERSMCAMEPALTHGRGVRPGPAAPAVLAACGDAEGWRGWVRGARGPGELLSCTGGGGDAALCGSNWEYLRSVRSFSLGHCFFCFLLFGLLYAAWIIITAVWGRLRLRSLLWCWEEKMWVKKTVEVQMQRSRDVRCSKESATSLSGHLKCESRCKKMLLCSL